MTSWNENKPNTINNLSLNFLGHAKLTVTSWNENKPNTINDISFTTYLQGHLSGFQGETKGLDEIPSDSAPGLSSPVDRSVFSPNTTISR